MKVSSLENFVVYSSVCILSADYETLLYICHHKQISAKTSELSKHHAELHETLKRRKKETDHCLDVQRFKREAEQAEQWIAMREQLLNSEDFGVSDSVLQ